MTPKILITGASGFIGSFIIEEALKRGYETWAAIRKSSSKEYLTHPAIHFIELKLTAPEKLQEQLKEHCSLHGKWDYIIHCAGATKCKKKADFDKTNYDMTRVLVDALVALQRQPTRFLYISTLSVFGPIHEQDNAPIQATDHPRPNTAYGKSKLKTEQYLEQLAGFPYLIFRPTGVYGPREKDYFLMTKSIQQHLDFAVGYKQQFLTFIYVKDLVSALFLAIDKQVNRKAYFVSDGKVYSSRDFSNYIQKELKIKQVVHLKCPLFILKIVSLLAAFVANCLGKPSTLNGDKYKIMRQRNWRCDITPIETEIGFRAMYDLERGVKESIAWYKKEGWL